MDRVAVRTLSIAVAMALSLLPGICAPASAQPSSVPTVLTIHLGTPDFPANPILDAAIRKGLTSGRDTPIDYFAEYLSAENLPVDQTAAALRDYIEHKYQGRRFDVVIAMTDVSLRFVLDHRAELFPDAAVVFSGAKAPDEATRTSAHGMTGVITGIAWAQTLKLALALHPRTEQVFVIATSAIPQSVAAVHAELRDVSSPAKLTYLTEPTVPELLRAVKAIPPRSLILYIWYAQYAPGVVLFPDEVAGMVAAAATVPVYGTSDFYLGQGVVGGVMRHTAETGARLGEMARQILDGRRPQDIPIETARVVPTFDWRQVRRWGIDRSDLPMAADVEFITPTVWEAYRGYIVAVIVVVTAQLLLIAGLVVQSAKRRRAEEVIRSREATLRSSYQRIRELAGYLINAQEAARADIARDLHDDVCQELAGVSVTVSLLKRSPGRIQDPDAQRTLDNLLDQTRHMSDGIRRLSHELHPATLRLLGLSAALKSHCSEVEKRHGVKVTFKAGDIGQVSPDVAVCLFRIAQESLRNAIVHGQAKRVTVTLGRTGPNVDLIVSDDGRGFDLASVRQHGGLGLVSMEERAHLYGGEMEVITGQQMGTTIRVRCPAAAGEDGARTLMTSA